MDLVRAILMHLERSVEVDADVAELVRDLEADGYRREQLSYHYELMAEAGLIKGFDVGAASVGWLPQRLTWVGHEFLDAARNEDRWGRAKSLIDKTVDSAPFEMWKEVLSELSRDAIRQGGRPSSRRGRKRLSARPRNRRSRKS